MMISSILTLEELLVRSCKLMLMNSSEDWSKWTTPDMMLVVEVKESEAV